jgi:hypothetical protein
VWLRLSLEIKEVFSQPQISGVNPPVIGKDVCFFLGGVDFVPNQYGRIQRVNGHFTVYSPLLST